LQLLFFFLETEHVSGINMPIFRSLRLRCWTTTLAVLFLDCCVLELGCGSARVVSGLPAEAAGSPDTTPAEPHPYSKTQKTKNVTANVVVQQHNRKLLKMGILMPETCWVSKKKNKSSKWHLIGFLFFSYYYELHHSVPSKTPQNLRFVCPWLDSNQTLSNRSNWVLLLTITSVGSIPAREFCGSLYYSFRSLQQTMYQRRMSL